MDQVARLRDKLGRERALREQADMLNDDDIGELIKFLNAGGSLGFGMPQAAGNNKNGPPAPVTIAATVVQNPVNDLGRGLEHLMVNLNNL